MKKGNFNIEMRGWWDASTDKYFVVVTANGQNFILSSDEMITADQVGVWASRAFDHAQGLSHE